MAVFSQAPDDGRSGIGRSRDMKVSKIGWVVGLGIGLREHRPLYGLKAVVRQL
ncbi:MAG: hypothetical protein HP498_10545 [Nitrospira sp.]|jgi:hypothetical protein|nr:hypothetical protein [Nitrospira sp.]